MPIFAEPVPQWLATINSSLILVSGVLVAVGYVLIRQGKRDAHRNAMLAATAFAAVFLVVYVGRLVVYENKLFAGEELWRTVYLGLLVVHVIVATALGPLVLYQDWLGLRRRFRRHRALGPWTVGIWAFVVVTGWVIYFALYAG